MIGRDQVQLNEQQQAAATFGGRHLRLLAGPGSGKTATLVHLVDHLVRERGVPFSDICAITFTTKAAEQLRRRLARTGAGRDSYRGFIGTAHALAFELVHSWGGMRGWDPSFTILTEEDERDLCRRVAKELRPKTTSTMVHVALRFMLAGEQASMVGQHLVDHSPRGPLPIDGGGVAWAGARQVVQLCRQLQVLTFDLLMHEAIELLRARKVEALCRPWPWVLYDEVQDFSWHDAALVEALEPEHLVVVGDPAQNIYSFRGTSHAFLDQLPARFPGMETIALPITYRCASAICDVATRLINASCDHCLGVRTPPLQTARHDWPGLVGYLPFNDEEAEARAAAAWVADGDGRYAVLTRTHRQHQLISDALTACGVQHQVLGDRDLFKQDTVRRLLAIMRLVVNPRDELALRMAVNFPILRASNLTLANLRLRMVYESAPFFHLVKQLPGAAGSLSDFAAVVERLHLAHLAGDDPVATPASLLAAIIKHLDITTALAVAGFEHRLAVVNRLTAWCAAWQQRQEAAPTVGRLLHAATWRAEQDSMDDEVRVLVATLHAVKGLEFDGVWIAGVEEGLLPKFHRGDDVHAKLQEERQLLYVGITRARHHLRLSWCAARSNFQGQLERTQGPSRFLAEAMGHPHGGHDAGDDHVQG